MHNVILAVKLKLPEKVMQKKVKNKLSFFKNVGQKYQEIILNTDAKYSKINLYVEDESRFGLY